jgi:hypothetical protein
VDRAIDYSQIDYLVSSRNPEISRLGIIVKDLKERVELLEKGQTELLDKLNSMQKSSLHASSEVTKPTTRKTSKYACDLCLAKFSKSALLQKHRKQAHKAPYNI